MKWGELLPEACPPGSEGITVNAVVAHSQALQPNGLFFALSGHQTDGHRYIHEAVAAGAVGVVAERSVEVPPGTPLAVHPQARWLWGEAAARVHRHPGRDLCLVGVTGTNGKTSVAWLIRHLLPGAPQGAAFMGTLGWGRPGSLGRTQQTTPDPGVLQDRLEVLRTAGVQSVAMEVSSHALVQQRLAGCELQGAVWTNLTPEHLDYHSSLAAYREAKARLFARSELDFAILNREDPSLFAFERVLRPGTRRLLYGLREGEVAAEVFDCRLDGLYLQARTPVGRVVVRSPLVGRINVSNLLAAVAVGVAFGLTPEVIGECLSTALPIPGRMEDMGETSYGARVWVDYAHTPDALARTLAGVRELVPERLWCVFGCGGERDDTKRPAMGEVAAQVCDRVVLTSDNPRSEPPEAITHAISAGMLERAPEVILDREAAIHYALVTAKKGDGVVIAGKGHETAQEIAGSTIPFSDQEVVRSWSLSGRGA